MRNISLFLTILLLSLAFACSDDKKTEQKTEETPSIAASKPDAAPPAINNPETTRFTPPQDSENTPRDANAVKLEPTSEKMGAADKKNMNAVTISTPDMDPVKADKIMAFCNSAQHSLDDDWNRAAEMYYNLGHIYLRVFNLPADVKPIRRRRADLVPPKGLFSETEVTDLTKAMDNMDKALASMLTHYRNLEKYVADPNIIDNGKQGRIIASQLERDYKSYMGANKNWLAIINEKAKDAEAILLKDHPLGRQALCASRIMTLTADVSGMLKAKKVDRQELSGISTEMAELIKRAEKPPFPGSASLERLFHIFLKNAAVYNDVLKRACLEGVFEIQKNELTLAGRVCRETYNDFVKNFNGNI